MHKLGEYLGYTGNPCVNCGRYRVERFSNGYERCEKCAWVPQIDNYISDDEFYADDLGEEWSNMEDRIEYGTDGSPYKLFMSTEALDKICRWQFGPTPEFPMAIKGMSKEEMLDTLRPKGEWKIGGKTTHYHYCSICGKDGDLQDNFCRNCGAMMQKGSKE